MALPELVVFGLHLRNPLGLAFVQAKGQESPDKVGVRPPFLLALFVEVEHDLGEVVEHALQGRPARQQQAKRAEDPLLLRVRVCVGKAPRPGRRRLAHVEYSPQGKRSATAMQAWCKTSGKR